MYLQDNKYHGKGTFIYSNNDEYTGEWSENLYHGRGIFKYGNGDKYEGDYLVRAFLWNFLSGIMIFSIVVNAL